MQSRRDFLKQAALLSGATVWNGTPAAILRAMEIDPEMGSTYLDAEHIVICMQENRAFDHALGCLRGVRGYNDPRVHVRPDGTPVWLQTSDNGEVFAPFRLDIKESNATWTGSLPHDWHNQVWARNDGHYDKWLQAKASDTPSVEHKPMTLGHYTREDLPFYYAFADAFTVCDQHFCSAFTGTMPNRIYQWTGTIRAEQNANSKPHVFNEEADHDTEVSWTTFPERLEDAGISWKIYQNELDIDTGLDDEHMTWLSNFSDNPIEYFTQFNVRFSRNHQAHLKARVAAIPGEIEKLKADTTKDNTKSIKDLEGELKSSKATLEKYSEENFQKLSQRDRNLHEKAFVINDGDPHYREIEALTYEEGGEKRSLSVPKGDLLYQFRKDVESGNLPTVSWLISPEAFSDHPSSAWYGAWYVAESLDILTKNPEVWKKTIFILNYDENDGYFDHFLPFTAPNPADPESGKVSPGIDAGVEYITREQDKAFRPSYPPQQNSIGLGYRVPMIVASPWSRGGTVCSEVFDLTSSLQFMEHWLTHRTGKKISEPNISAWRRTVCGDLTSVFQPFSAEEGKGLTIERDPFLESIHKAKYKNLPNGYKALEAEDIEGLKVKPVGASFLPKQEPGVRKSNPLNYELYCDGRLSPDKGRFEVSFRAGDKAFGQKSCGSPFKGYVYSVAGGMQERAYAVTAGDTIADQFDLSKFKNGAYAIRIDGPNGFMREFKGDASEPTLHVAATYPMSKGKPNGNLQLEFHNASDAPCEVSIEDVSYGAAKQTVKVAANASHKVTIDTKPGQSWYDLDIRIAGHDRFQRRYAGRVETGKWAVSDPAMGNLA